LEAVRGRVFFIGAHGKWKHQCGILGITLGYPSPLESSLSTRLTTISGIELENTPVGGLEWVS
jgi:hypothetical protein